MLEEIFGDEYDMLKSDSNKIIGIWNMVDKRLRNNAAMSPAEIALHSFNADIFRKAVGARIYETSYLHYKSEDKGFMYDFRNVTRWDYFGRAKTDISNVCSELLQRVELSSARPN